MKKSEFMIMPLLLVLPLSSAVGQSLGDRLKQGIKSAAPTVTQGPPNNTKPTSAAQSAAPAALSLPAISKANPDVLGIKVGVSTVDDVRSVLNEATLALRVEEHPSQLRGQPATGRGIATQIVIPNSDYVEVMSGTSKTYQPRPYDTPCGQITANCQDLQVRFSAPPDKGTVLALTRTIHFASGPLTDTVIKGLVDKYGQPGFRDAQGDNGVELHLVWAWAADGKPVPLNARHTCASQAVAKMTTNGSIEGSKNALQAGCAALLFVIINQENSVTKFETLLLIDHYGIYAASAKTATFVADGVAKYEACEREKAAKTGVSPEFGDGPIVAKASPVAAGATSPCAATKAP